MVTVAEYHSNDDIYTSTYLWLILTTPAAKMINLSYCRFAQDGWLHQLWKRAALDAILANDNRPVTLVSE